MSNYPKEILKRNLNLIEKERKKYLNNKYNWLHKKNQDLILKKLKALFAEILDDSGFCLLFIGTIFLLIFLFISNGIQSGNLIAIITTIILGIVSFIIFIIDPSYRGVVYVISSIKISNLQKKIDKKKDDINVLEKSIEFFDLIENAIYRLENSDLRKSLNFFQKSLDYFEDSQFSSKLREISQYDYDLNDIKGIGSKMKEKLIQAGYPSPKTILNSNPSDLIRIKGINKNLEKSILNSAKILYLSKKEIESYITEIKETIIRNDNNRFSEIQVECELGEQKLLEKNYDVALKRFRHAMGYCEKIFNFEGKLKARNLVSNKLDKAYSSLIEAKIKEIKNNILELASIPFLDVEQKYNEIANILLDAQRLFGNISKKVLKNKMKKSISKMRDKVYLTYIERKIDHCLDLRSAEKFDESIEKFTECIDDTKKINNSTTNRKTINKIEKNIKQTRIAKIRSIALDLGTKYTRLQIREIAEKCNEEKNLIILTVKQMVADNEIYAEYFESSKAVVFNQQANINDIDMLMEKYKEWETDKGEKT
ncbi:MAG: hypothetical protein GF311_11860 [Candidatus Lokiarchaeota archaeon]|nr:hypothetical protein [Candidatus Lokiarchaeota archaeon]